MEKGCIITLQQKIYRIKQVIIQIGWVNVTVNEFMMQSGIPVNLKGFIVVERAIEFCIKNPEISSMELYEAMANECNTTPTGAERRIRIALERGFGLMDESLKRKLFGIKEKIRNTEYVKTVAYAIKNHVI